LVEDDWWEDDDDIVESSCSDSVEEHDVDNDGIEKGTDAFTDDDDDDDVDSRVADYVEHLQRQYATTFTPSWEKKNDISNDTNTNNSDDDSMSDRNRCNSYSNALLPPTKDGKRFCNRGLQTWYRARQSWIAAVSTTDQASEVLQKKKKTRFPIPDAFRKELVQCLIDRRQFELSQSIPLSCVVDAYQEVWRENGCD
jgi:hypothetical protein